MSRNVVNAVSPTAITRGVPCADAKDGRGGRGETGIGARGVA